VKLLHLVAIGGPINLILWYFLCMLAELCHSVVSKYFFVHGAVRSQYILEVSTFVLRDVQAHKPGLKLAFPIIASPHDSQ
jgi:hypothetical protein